MSQHYYYVLLSNDCVMSDLTDLSSQYLYIYMNSTSMFDFYFKTILLYYIFMT